MKIGVVGNCQVVPMANVLGHYLQCTEVVPVEMWRLRKADYHTALQGLNNCDLIFAHPIYSADFSPFTTVELKAFAARQGAKFTTIQNLYFSGPIPDCRCVGRLGQRVKGPVSDYHSEIILRSFLNGDSRKKCLERLLSGEGIDPMTAWEKSRSELFARDKNVDVPFADEILDFATRSYSFHYFNHPRPNIFTSYGKKIVSEALSLPMADDSWTVSDLLAKFGSWPVYEWVAEKLNLGYSFDRFIRCHGGGELDFSECVDRSYEIYSETPRENLV
ncbi:MAG: WcbI family polysaccharide biosynthesis putative acetyltransferase [Paracoccaceae bacterium]